MIRYLFLFPCAYMMSIPENSWEYFYVNCAPEIFSLDKINVLPKSAEFTLKRADDVLYSTSDGDGAKENQVIEYERDISCNGVVLTAVFDKTELAAEYRMIWKLMVGALLIFLIIFVVLSYFLAQYLTKPITCFKPDYGAAKRETYNFGVTIF